jgi:hypothetical protein
MSSSLWDLLEELDRQKKAYHQKLLSSDGELATFMRTIQAYDYIIDISSLLIPQFYYSSMHVGLIYDFDLSFVEPLNLEFEWRIPSFDEWMNGVSVVIVKTTSPYATAIEQFIQYNISPEVAEAIEKTRPNKGRYGISKYGYSYYDPANVREFLRNAITLMFKKHMDPSARKVEIEELAKKLNVNINVAKSSYNRISMLMHAGNECFMLGYGVLGKTKLCQKVVHSPPSGLVPFIDYEGKEVVTEITALDQMQYGFILGATALGYSFVTPRTSIYKYGAPIIERGLKEKLENFRKRLMLTAPAFSNYVKPEEASDPNKCERTEVWGELMSMRYIIEHNVEALLSKAAPDIDPFVVRQYKNAVLQLLGHVAKRHKWGFNIYKTLEDEELRSWWIGYWVKQGLDKEVLNTLYDNAKAWLSELAYKKVKLGEKLRLERLGVLL